MSNLKKVIQFIKIKLFRVIFQQDIQEAATPHILITVKF